MVKLDFDYAPALEAEMAAKQENLSMRPLCVFTSMSPGGEHEVSPYIRIHATDEDIYNCPPVWPSSRVPL